MKDKEIRIDWKGTAEEYERRLFEQKEINKKSEFLQSVEIIILLAMFYLWNMILLLIW